MINPYEVLGVENQASKSEIVDAFYKLKGSQELNDDPNSAARLQLIENAFKILNDPVKKEEIDRYFPKVESALKGSSFSSYKERTSSEKLSQKEIELKMYECRCQLVPYLEEAKKSLVKGFVWFVIGLVVSIGSFSAARRNGGGTYVVAYGAVIFGAAMAIKGIYNYVSTKKEMQQTMENLQARLESKGEIQDNSVV